MLPSWITKYVGLKFGERGRGPDEFDCWGLVRWIYLHELSITVSDHLQDYYDVGDSDGIEGVVQFELNHHWDQVNDPQPLDVVMFNIATRPVHVGIVISKDHFIHAPEADFTRIERLSSVAWKRRTEGFYRHRNRSLSGSGKATPSQD